MSEMIERVSRTLVEKLGPALSGGKPVTVRDVAVAVIETMREPTEVMLRAGSDQLDCAREGECWRAMIDEALK